MNLLTAIKLIKADKKHDVPEILFIMSDLSEKDIEFHGLYDILKANLQYYQPIIIDLIKIENCRPKGTYRLEDIYRDKARRKSLAIVDYAIRLLGIIGNDQACNVLSEKMRVPFWADTSAVSLLQIAHRSGKDELVFSQLAQMHRLAGMNREFPACINKIRNNLQFRNLGIEYKIPEIAAYLMEWFSGLAANHSRMEDDLLAMDKIEKRTLTELVSLGLPAVPYLLPWLDHSWPSYEKEVYEEGNILPGPLYMKSTIWVHEESRPKRLAWKALWQITDRDFVNSRAAKRWAKQQGLI